MSATEDRARELVGHAIQYERVYDSEGKLVGENLHHALTCRKCAANRLPTPTSPAPSGRTQDVNDPTPARHRTREDLEDSPKLDV